LGSETLFYVFGTIAIAASLMVIGQRNPVYSVLLLIASFGALSGLYVLLDAPFVAVIQIIVYAGAIMVLFLFVVMLLNAPHEDTEEDLARLGIEPPARSDGQLDANQAAIVYPRIGRGPARFGTVLALGLLVELWWGLTKGHETGAFGTAAVSSVAALGRSLFTDYAFPFEVTSVLILVAMLGAVLIARREPR
jgi:NADH-quinone oxidoreductase subunit J